MCVGGYLFTKTLDRWITDIVSSHMLNLIDDVANEIEQKKLDVLHMLTAKVDQFLDNLSQASTLHRFTLINEEGRVLGDSQISLKKISQLDDHSDYPEVVAALQGKKVFPLTLAPQPTRICCTQPRFMKMFMMQLLRIPDISCDSRRQWRPLMI